MESLKGNSWNDFAGELKIDVADVLVDGELSERKKWRWSYRKELSNASLHNDKILYDSDRVI